MGRIRGLPRAWPRIRAAAPVISHGEGGDPPARLAARSAACLVARARRLSPRRAGGVSRIQRRRSVTAADLDMGAAGRGGGRAPRPGKAAGAILSPKSWRAGSSIEPTPSRHQADTEQARAGGAVPSRARRWRARDGRGADSAGPRGAHRPPFAGRAAAGRHAGAWARAARHSRRRCRRDDLSARHAKGGRAAPLIAVDALPVSPGVCAPRRPAARGRQARAGLWQAAARRPLYSQCRCSRS